MTAGSVSLLLVGPAREATVVADLVAELVERGAGWEVQVVDPVDLSGTLAAAPGDRPQARVVLVDPDPSHRRELAHLVDELGADPIVLVHPDATLGSLVELSPGSLVEAGARISTNVRVGRHGRIGPNATIGHDVVLRDCVTVGAGVSLSGAVEVGAGAEIGARSVVLPQITIGTNARVHPGSVVTRPVPEGVSVLGSPARVAGGDADDRA